MCCRGCDGGDDGCSRRRPHRRRRRGSSRRRRRRSSRGRSCRDPGRGSRNSRSSLS